LTGARAKADIEPIRFDYRAAQDCPSEAAFTRQVLARTTSARLANPDEPARVFEVELTRTGPKVQGSLAIREPDGTSVARRITGTNCSQVATVLALATALAIDPNAELAAPASLEPDAAFEPGAPTDSAADSTPKPGVNPKTTPRTGSTPEPSSATSSAPLDRPPLSFDPALSVETNLPMGPWRYGFALGPRFTSALGPDGARGVSVVAGGWRSRARGHLSHAGIELGAAWTGEKIVRDAGARLLFISARPRLCGLGISFGASTLGPCIAAELGVVRGEGSQIPFPSSPTRVWATGEASLRLDLALGESWLLDLDGGISFPFTRYRFHFDDPNVEIDDLPWSTLTLEALVGWRFQ
jgi:hypothetical protein